MDKPLENFPLEKVTTLKIGGPAKYFLEISDLGKLKEILNWAKKKSVAYLVIGGGSNLLVSDQGVKKLIIKNSLLGIFREGDTVKVKSGTPLQEFVNFCIDNGLSGTNKLTGIPGSVGGAVYGNAGAYGQTISDNLESVLVFNGEAEITLSKEECQFGYRDSGFKRNHYTILEVTFKLLPGNSPDLKKEAEEVLEKRLVKYPPGLKCPGSFFKNIIVSSLPQEVQAKIPQEKIQYGKITAGYLLEEVGAKGLKEGQIEIADYHANLFINKGGGMASDFYNLAKRVSEKVKQKFGITLEPEVQLIGLDPL